MRVVAEALVARQGLSADAAWKIVEKLSKQPDVMAAAEEWTRSGAYPDHPAIEGFTPSTVAESFPEFTPSQVFTMLCALRDDPETVQRWIRFDRRSPFDPRPSV